jgi:hypothetical protein
VFPDFRAIPFQNKALATKTARWHFWHVARTFSTLVLGRIVLGMAQPKQFSQFAIVPRAFLPFLKGKWGWARARRAVNNSSYFSDSLNNFVSQHRLGEHLIREQVRGPHIIAIKAPQNLG